MEVTGNGLIAGYIHTGAKSRRAGRGRRGQGRDRGHGRIQAMVKDITPANARDIVRRFSREQYRPRWIAKEREIAAQSRPAQGKAAQPWKNPGRRAGQKKVFPDLLPRGLRAS